MTSTAPRSIRIIGPGRVGAALAAALERCGWDVRASLRRGEDLSAAARDVDLLVIATGDAAIAEISASIDPVDTTVVAHLSGSLGLAVLDRHRRRAAIHPLTSIPDPEIGVQRLMSNTWFAVDADGPESMAMALAVVDSLGGRWFTITDDQRAEYHAAAAVASNHVVALLAHAMRIADAVGAPREAYLELLRATIDNVEAMGVADALTGPVARGDWETVERHRAAIDESELELYDALVVAAQRLAESRDVDDHGRSPNDGAVR